MTTIKSYTDLGQSKKLAEILPLESADMLWEQHGAEPYVTIKPWTTIGKSIGCHCVSCWSLAALLSVVPEEVSLNSFKDGNWNAMVQQNGKIIYSDANNPVDACYELILKLHELKML